VKCWGNNAQGQLGDGTNIDSVTPTDVAAFSQGVARVAAGDYHTCVLTTTGSVRCWATDVAGVTAGVAAIDGGGVHDCLLTTTGGVKCWGSNGNGQLGDGTFTQRPTPVDVLGLTSGIRGLAAGFAHTCSVTTAGAVKCWGYNNTGQVGDGTQMDQLSPASVSGLASGVASVDAGGNHTCALTAGGGVKCWGWNVSGQLGDGTNSVRLTPVNVLGLSQAAQTITFTPPASLTIGVATPLSATASSGLTVTFDTWTPGSCSVAGNVVTALAGEICGIRASQAGGGGNAPAPQQLRLIAVLGPPAIVSPSSASITSTTAMLGGHVTSTGGFAISARGVVYAPTATNANPEIGGSGVQQVPSAGSVGVFAESVTGLSFSTNYSFKAYATNSAGTVYTDVATFSTTAVPTQIAMNAGDGQSATAGTAVPVPPSVIVRDASNNPVSGVTVQFAVTSGGGVVADATQVTNAAGIAAVGSWTLGGALGTQTLSAAAAGLIGSPISFTATALVKTVTQIEAGERHSCALTESGGVQCWGRNEFGQLGDGTTSPRNQPVDVFGLTSGIAQISAGAGHTCALTVTGGVKCWGLNNSGQLGDGTAAPRVAPVDVVGLASGVAAIAAGGSHTCALTTAGGVKCWGFNGNGAVGDGTQVNRSTPVDTQGLLTGVSRMNAGGGHTCAVTTAGGVKCWGYNFGGALGDGTTTARVSPVDVSGLSSGVVDLSLGTSHTCALTTPGGLKCWGRNDTGGLGDGSATNRLTPVDVSGLAAGVADVTAGGIHTCAVMNSGGAKCWGWNQHGQVGDGATTNRLSPVDVTGLSSGVAALTAGSRHTCALATGGAVKCWGDSEDGQLGDGTNSAHGTPGNVIGFTQAAQPISFVPPTALTVGVAATLNATAGSGLTVAFDTWTPDTCTVTGNSVTATATALCGIRASDPGDLSNPPAAQELRLVSSGGAPSVISPTSVSVIATTATLGGTVVSDGGLPVTGRGVVYAPTATNADPRIGGTGVVQASAGGTTGSFTLGVSGLTQLTAHSFRAYVTYSGGEGYTPVAGFTTQGIPTQIAVNAGDNQSVPIGTAVPIKPSVIVRDMAGNPVSGVSVTFAIGGGGGSLTGASQVTNAQGVATVGSWTLGSTPGTNNNTLTATSTGLSGSPIAFLATARAIPTQMAILAGNNQTSTTGAFTPIAPAVIVRDVVNLPVEGVSVTFAVTSGGGTVVGAVQTTNAQGVATVGGWVLGPNVGLNNNTLSATAPGLSGSPLSFTASTQAPDPEPAATLVGAGDHFSCAVTTSGGVKCWGSNQYGKLGDGTNVHRSRPTDVLGLTAGAARVAVGLDHACALTNGGAVKCWGRNSAGQLGDGTTVSRNSPVSVLGLGSGVISIAAGGEQTCALMTAGGVKCWGVNTNGQVGDNTTTMRTSPVDVTGLASGVVAVSAGGSHTCALVSGGTMKCWGANTQGQLGDGSTAQSLTPVAVTGVTNAAEISAGGQHTCARTAAGGLACWGWNSSGQLGDGTTTSRNTPGGIIGFTGIAAGISAGQEQTCATTAGGLIRCWGRNDQGQLGDGTTVQRPLPVDVLGLTGAATSVSAGSLHTCAVNGIGGAQCWGYNDYGQLGREYSGDRTRAMDVVGLTSGFKAVDGGLYHTCAQGTGGALKCWGNNLDGQVGNGTQTPQYSPVASVRDSHQGPPSAGGYHTCSVHPFEGTRCWGYNGLGGLGDGTTVTRPYGVVVAGVFTDLTSVTSGLFHSCGLTSGGGVKCWGNNGNGQLGDGSTSTRLLADWVVGLTSGVTSIAAGDFHTCAVTTGGGVKCWGSNNNGKLGDGTTTQRTTPVDVTGLTSGVLSVTTGIQHTCALTVGGGVKCWGDNSIAQLGDGTTSDSATPVNTLGLGSGVAGVAAGGFHTCAVTLAGAAKCWGNNFDGQLGDGTTIPRTTPTTVLRMSDGVTAIGAGGYHTCGVARGGVQCWGYNGFGALGNGTSNSASQAVTALRSRQSITSFTAPSTLTVGVPVALSGTSSSGLPVTFDTWTPSTCVVSGNTVTAIALTLCGIRASQPGDSFIAPASQQFRLASSTPGLPVIVAPTKTSISMAKATLGATVSLDGGSPILDRGVVVSVTSANANPMIGGSGVTQFSTTGTTGVFTLFATGLNPSTAYSFKAYAINALGTSYTAVSTFTTPAPPSRVFVSSSGSDANVCSDQLAPCRSISEGIAQVLADGEVIILKPGEYETTPLIITKGVKVTSPSGTVAFVRQPITINAPGGRVVLRGLTLKGNGTGVGITLVAASSLSVEETTFDRWGTGLRLVAGSGSFVSVTNSVFAVNIVGVQLASGGTNGVSIEGTRFEGNGTGLSISGGSFFVRESSFIGNSTAGASIGGGSADIQRSEFTLNGIGVNALSGAVARLSRSVVFGNTIGLFAAGGSTLASAGTNVVRGNGTDTSGTITVVPEQ
jgi:alpha-tubulin suppressor-like RCC1 family protein